MRSEVLLHEDHEDIRQFAAEQGMETVEAVEAGMREKADEFREKGGEIFVAETSS